MAKKHFSNPNKKIPLKVKKYSSQLNENQSLDLFYNQITLLYQQGKIEQALKLSDHALKQFPKQTRLLENAGAFSMMIGEKATALLYYQQYLSLKPNSPEILNKMAYVLKGEGRYDEAEEAYKNALKFRPDFVDALYNLGILFNQQERYEEAESVYKRVLTYQPAYIKAYINLGLVLDKQERYSDSEKCYKDALRLEPDCAEIFFNLGGLYLQQKFYEKAEASFQQALKYRADYNEVYFCLGHCFDEQQYFEKAEVYFLQVLKTEPDNAECYFSLGNMFAKQKYFSRAKKYLIKALEINPDLIEAHYNLSLLLLMQGGFKEGWKAYEFRYHPDKIEKIVFPPKIDIPQWQGESLINKSLFVWSEQGVGDEVMFNSCLNGFENNNGRISLACDTRLVKLFTRSFPNIWVIEKDPANRYSELESAFDFQCGIGSLPGFFRLTIQSFEFTCNYLVVDEELLKKWQSRYDLLEYDINIGISWRGGADEKRQNKRSILLAEWEPILNQKANFINLQYGCHQKEVNAFEEDTGLSLYDWEDADPLVDLDNFAAQIKALDLVISIDNSTVHFSGALGVKTFVMLPFSQDWRWMEGQKDSYWYPKVMRLFKQDSSLDWNTLIKEVSQAVAKKIDSFERRIKNIAK